MGSHIFDGLLALVALVAALSSLGYPNLIVIIATALIFIHAISHMLGVCPCDCSYNHKMQNKQIPKKSAKKKK